MKKTFDVELSQEEINENATKFAVASTELRELNKQLDELVNGLSDTIRAKKEEVAKYSQMIRIGKEIREVDCEQRKNKDKGLMESVRLDTNEVYESRPLTEKEIDEE